MGIEGIDMDSDVAKHLNLNESRGFLVTSIPLGDPADKSGIKGGYKTSIVDGKEVELGGDVIVRIDNVTVEKNRRLAIIFSDKKCRRQIDLLIVRDDTTKRIQARLESEGQTDRYLSILPSTPQIPQQPPLTPYPPSTLPSLSSGDNFKGV